MGLTVHSIASGSSGNSILIKDDQNTLLIDAGIGIRRLVAALEAVEVNPADLSAILITHEHSDHVAGAVRMSRRFGIPLAANAPTLASIAGSNDVPHMTIELGEEIAFGQLCVRSFPVSHDATCPVGYSVSCSGTTVCIATDTGALTVPVRNEASLADLLILESNHDVNMLVAGPYPWHLKRRIMGDWGHLSNETAASLLFGLAASGRNPSVWLAHLSKTNNSPEAALSSAKRVLSRCPGNQLKVEVALRDIPSLRWNQSQTTYQISLFSPMSATAPSS
jgi:phosphoribosyl 1,2-cyclic phosphodiesterase